MTNYHRVNADVWRGARPHPVDFANVKAQFKSVLSLEGLDEDEREAAWLAPVRLISCPISSWDIYVTGIATAYLSAILDAVHAADKPLLIHCQHGRDRTGLIVAAYRAGTGWTKKAAMDEALMYGYRGWLNFGLNKTWGRL